MTRKLNIDIIAKDKSRQALKQVQGNLDNTKKSILNVKNALIGLGVGLAARSIINVGKEVENLQVRFKFLFGSIEEGSLAFDNLSKFASQVPFSLEEITAASGNLAVVAKDANDLNRILEITGNVAAVTGLDFATAGSQIQRAFSGGIAAADIFREKGVRQLLGFKEGAKVSIEETVAAFEEAFSGDGKFAQATEELAQTLTGTTSMLQDKLFNFQKLISEQLIGTLTDELGDLNKFLEGNAEEIEEIANTIGTSLAEGILLLGAAVKTTADIFSFFNRPIYDIVNQLTGMDDVIKDLRINNPKLAQTLDDLIYKFTPFEPIVRKISVETGHLSHNNKELNEELKKNVKEIVNSASAYSQGQASALKFNEALIVQKRLILDLSRSAIPSINTELGRLAQHNQDNSELIDSLNESKFPRFKQVLEDAGNTTKQLDDVFSNTFENFSETLADSLMTGKFAFKDFARSVLRDIARMIARQQALLFYTKAFNFLGGSIFGISLPTPAPRSSGGRVNAGMPYMTGEAGKELFIPQTSGTIVPNNQLAGAGTTNINFTINTVDAQGVDELLTNRRSTIINVINDALNRQGKEALV